MARIMKAPEERKQEIVEAALDLFIKKGYLPVVSGIDRSFEAF